MSGIGAQYRHTQGVGRRIRNARAWRDHLLERGDLTNSQGMFLKLRCLIDLYAVKVKDLIDFISPHLSEDFILKGRGKWNDTASSHLVQFFARHKLRRDKQTLCRPLSEDYFKDAFTTIEACELWLDQKVPTWSIDDFPPLGPRVPEASRDSIVARLRSLAVDKRKSVAVIWGESGSGKTTLISAFVHADPWPKAGCRPIYIDCRIVQTVPLLLAKLKQKIDLEDAPNAARPLVRDDMKRIVSRLNEQPALIVFDDFYTPQTRSDSRPAVVRNEQFVDLFTEFLVSAPTTKFVFVAQPEPKELTAIARKRGWDKSQSRAFSAKALAADIDQLGFRPHAIAPLTAMLKPNSKVPSLLNVKLAATCIEIAMSDGVLPGKEPELRRAIYESPEALVAILRNLCTANWMCALRRVALSEDGLRATTLVELLERTGRSSKTPWDDVAAKDALTWFRHILLERRSDDGELEFDMDEKLRRAIVEDWLKDDPAEMRDVHRHIARIALTRAREEPAGDDAKSRSETLRLLVQAYSHLLASVDRAAEVAPPQILESKQAKDAETRLKRGDESEQDRINLAITILDSDLEQGAYALSHRFGAADLRLHLYLAWFRLGQGGQHLTPDEMLPSDPENVPPHPIYDTLLERIAFSALGCHRVSLARSAAAIGLSRLKAGELRRERLQLLFTQVDAFVRQGFLQAATEKGRSLVKEAEDILEQPDQGRDLSRALLNFSRAHGRLAEVHLLRGELDSAASEIEQSLFGYEKFLNPQDLTVPMLRGSFARSLEWRGRPALVPSPATVRKILECAIRIDRLNTRTSQPAAADQDLLRQLTSLHGEIGARGAARQQHDDAAAFAVDYSRQLRLESARQHYSLAFKDAEALRASIRHAREYAWENVVSPVNRLLTMQEDARVELHLANAHIREKDPKLAKACLERAVWISQIMTTIAGSHCPLWLCDALLSEAEAQKALSEWKIGEDNRGWEDPLARARDLIEAHGYNKRRVDADMIQASADDWIGPSMSLIC